MRPMIEIPHLELCLCRKCAGVFYADPERFIRRKDPCQTEFDRCVICARPHSADYLIWERRNLEANLKN